MLTCCLSLSIALYLFIGIYKMKSSTLLWEFCSCQREIRIRKQIGVLICEKLPLFSLFSNDECFCNGNDSAILRSSVPRELPSVINDPSVCR